MKPNFLCIGAQKAGTTWLHHNLKTHPQIWLPPYKEIHYFDQVHLGESKSKIIAKNRLVTLRNQLNETIDGEDISYDYMSFLAHLAFSEVKDDRWYLALFNCADSRQAVGEITPGYSALPDAGVKHIRDLLGNVRLIYILRNPVKRAWSQAVMSKRKEVYHNNYIEDEEWIRTVELRYHKLKGNQVRTIQIYEKYFGQDRILYLFYDEICLKPLSFLEKVCTFLEIDYDKKYFKESIIHSIFNNNPIVNIPEKVENHLIQKYQEQEKWIVERFRPSSFKL